MTDQTAWGSAEDGTALRQQMPALANKIYFNYGGQGPLPQRSLEAIHAAFAAIQELGPFAAPVWPYVSRRIDALRQRLASSAWLGVGPRRLAFTENVTSGCVLPLWGLPWQSGDQLLISDAEHPGVVAACRELARRQALEVRFVAVADLRGDPTETDAAVLQRVEEACTARTRLVVLSHLLWNTGPVMPIAALAERLRHHQGHPWLLVDGAQSLGAIPVAAAAAAADIYACTGHKWCCGPEGLGVVAVSERLLEQASPTLIGWRSLADENAVASSPANSQFHGDARRFEVATSCTPLFAGLERSLALLEAEGSAEQRLAWIRARSGQLWRGLRSIPGVETLLQVEPPAGLVSFTLETVSPTELVARLGERGLWLRTLADPFCVRACTHITTTSREVEQLLAVVADLVTLP
jgi:L-cysteine/cystine lyase